MVLVSEPLHALVQRICIRILEDIDHHDHLVIPMQDFMRLQMSQELGRLQEMRNRLPG